jgi:hypothetical protein
MSGSFGLVNLLVFCWSETYAELRFLPRNRQLAGAIG